MKNFKSKRLIRIADDTQFNQIKNIIEEISNDDLFELAEDLDEHAGTRFVEGIVKNDDKNIENLLNEQGMSLSDAFSLGIKLTENGWYNSSSPYIYMHDDGEIESIDEDYVKTLLTNNDNAMTSFINAIIANPNLLSVPQEIKDIINERV